MKNIKTIRLLIKWERTKLRRDDDENLNLGLMKTKRISQTILIFFTSCGLIATVTSAIASIFLNLSKEKKAQEICKTIFEKLYPIYKERHFQIYDLQQNDIYEKVNLMQQYLNQSLSENCEKPLKNLPWITKTPYNHQISPYNELTLVFEVMLNYYHAILIIAVDVLLMSMLIYVRFQFEIINRDLVASPIQNMT